MREKVTWTIGIVGTLLMVWNLHTIYVVLPDEAQQGLVAEVDAVEGADGDDRPVGGVGAGLEAGDDVHRPAHSPAPAPAPARTTSGRAAARPFS